jgi:hypothetical protein
LKLFEYMACGKPIVLHADAGNSQIQERAIRYKTAGIPGAD